MFPLWHFVNPFINQIMRCARVSLKLHLFLRVQFPKNITDMKIHRKAPGKENNLVQKWQNWQNVQLVHFHESSLNQLQCNLESHYLAEQNGMAFYRQAYKFIHHTYIQHIWRIMFQRYSSGNQKLALPPNTILSVFNFYL